MSFHDLIKKNYQYQVYRSQVIDIIREYFKLNDFLEVFTPIWSNKPLLEEHIIPLMSQINDFNGTKQTKYHVTSPEIFHKKLLAAGYKKIFEIKPCVRNYENINSPIHQTAFNLLEWYRNNSSYKDAMGDVKKLFKNIHQKLNDLPFFNVSKIDLLDWKFYSISELFKEYVKIDLLSLETWDDLINIAHKYSSQMVNTDEEAFTFLWVKFIEPFVKNTKGVVFIYDYPSCQSGMAKFKNDDTRFVERFEILIQGIEIINGYSELYDRKEQLKRMQKSIKWHIKYNPSFVNKKNENMYIDQFFLDSVSTLKNFSGAALGLERLMMILFNLKEIDFISLESILS